MIATHEDRWVMTPAREIPKIKFALVKKWYRKFRSNRPFLNVLKNETIDDLLVQKHGRANPRPLALGAYAMESKTEGSKTQNWPNHNQPTAQTL